MKFGAKEAFIAAGMTAALAGCGSSAQVEPFPGAITTAPSTAGCPSTEGLTDMALTGPSKEGIPGAVNKGECVQVYNQDTLQTVGRLASGEAFDIVCVSAKPEAFQIYADRGFVIGDINLSSQMTQRLEAGEFGDIPSCEAAAPTTSPQAQV